MSFDYKVTGKAFDLRVLRRVLALVAPYKLQFIRAIVLTLMTCAVGPSIPYCVQYMIDHFIRIGDIDGLTRFAMIILGLLVLQVFINYSQSYTTSWLGQMAILRLRKRMFQHIVKFRLRVYDRTPVGTMITRTISDIETIADVFGEGFFSIMADALQMIVVLVIMFCTSWKLSLISLSVLPFLWLAAYFFKEGVKKAFQDVRTQVGRMNAFLQEHITGMQIVQVFNREEEERNKFDEINKMHRDANIRSVFAYSVFFPVIEVLSAVSIALIVWFGAGEALDAKLTFGVITGFILYLNLLFRPMRQIADKFNTLQMGIVAGDRLFQVLDSEDFISDTGTLVPEIKGKVEVKDVYFAYNDEDWVLKGISFKIEEGKTLAIVGHTGAGKSSIVNLVNRLYPYQKGSILIDDINVEDYKLEWLRKNIAVVLQDVFLFSDTILNNIRLYNDNISRDEVIRAAKLVGAHDFIERLPGGYDYQVQERGATLSTGQRQLISFIRAIIQDPKILILDEATSSIDQETEEMIQRATDVLLKGRTSIVIAHRLATIQNADQIIVMEKGQIKERGRHEELLEQNGLYRKLYELQFTELVL